MNGGDEDEKGLLWKLPAIKSRELGKLGPGFGVGIGCGFGFGVGLIGGTGFGPGIPGLQLGFGLGAGCGVGLGFGYAVGRGIAYDDSRRYSNVSRFFERNANFPTQNEIDTLIDDLVVNTKKLIRATSHEVDKWKRGRW
nr:glycine-rich cell wall structural protein 1 [Ipomoea batatas]